MPHSPNPPTHDPDHTHKGWLNRATGAVRQQFLEVDIPTYFEYARQFTLCDNYYTDVAGPSTPESPDGAHRGLSDHRQSLGKSRL